MFKKTLIAAGLAIAIVTAPAMSADNKKPQKKAAPAAKQASIPVTLSPLPIELKTKDDSLAYALGMNIGTGMKKNFEQIDLKVNLDIVLKAMETMMKDQKAQLTEDQEKQILMAFQQEMQAKEMEKQQKAGDENMKKANEFLADNKTKEGVKVTASGLQYKEITAGTGEKPKSTDQVKVHYKGTLIDGTVFDSSIDRGEPITFPVTGVIPGWVEALQMMNKGSKWMLFIPPNLAYGERSPSPNIPPNSCLIFEVELLDIISADKPAEQPKK